MKRHEQGGITLQNVSVNRGTTNALHNVSLQIGKSTLTAVIGPNGAGKSTLLSVIAGIVKPTQGTVLLNEAPLPTDRKHIAQTTALLTQQAAHMPGFSVHDTVLLGRSPWLGPFGLPSRNDGDAATTILEELGIRHLSSVPVHELSTGERQRVHFARVLCQNTPFLLFDEPFSAQDIDGIGAMLRAMQRRAANGHTIVVVLHDLNLALAAFEQLLVMEKAELRCHGSPEEASFALQQVYGDSLQVVHAGHVHIALPVWR
jgi:ABC-type cobalamin/Fe3+-siderophores transport system ATPase subunit